MMSSESVLMLMGDPFANTLFGTSQRSLGHGFRFGVRFSL
jgi:hypothetical protein